LSMFPVDLVYVSASQLFETWAQRADRIAGLLHQGQAEQHARCDSRRGDRY
jgi:hypothetical protein